MKCVRTYLLFVCTYCVITKTHGFTIPVLDNLRVLRTLDAGDELADKNKGSTTTTEESLSTTPEVPPTTTITEKSEEPSETTKTEKSTTTEIPNTTGPTTTTDESLTTLPEKPPTTTTTEKSEEPSATTTTENPTTTTEEPLATATTEKPTTTTEDPSTTATTEKPTTTTEEPSATATTGKSEEPSVTTTTEKPTTTTEEPSGTTTTEKPTTTSEEPSVTVTTEKSTTTEIPTTTDLCTVNPCKNGGVCTIEGDSFKCNCKLPYLGKTCEEDLCTVNPCKNEGLCAIEEDSFICDCKAPYVGETCEEDLCTLNPCKNEGVCAIEGVSFKCYCKVPYLGKICEEEVDNDDHICSTNPCQNAGDCFQNGKEYICECQKGFYERNCTVSQWCKDNKETVCGGVDCVHNEGMNKSFCLCKENKIFDAKMRKCRDIDPCITKLLKNECMSPHEICRNGNCTCEKGYKYDDSKTMCVFDACLNKPCGNNLECNDNEDRTYTCSCKKGYVYNGKKCVEMDKCSMGMNCEQFCSKGRCSCADGFDLNSDNRTCSKNASTPICDKGCGVGKCAFNKEAEVCVCPTATYVEKNGTCIDRCAANSLLSNTCPSGIKCESDSELGFRCNCSGRYKQAEDRIHCAVRKMCTEGEGDEKCEEQSARCVESPTTTKGYKCICADGYDMDPKTDKCTHKCMLPEQVKACLLKLAVCEIEEDNGEYKAVCNCPPLFTEDKVSKKCDKKAENSFTGSFQVQRNMYEILPKINKRHKRSTPPIDYIKLNKDFKESLNYVYANFDNSKVLNCSDIGQNLNCSLEMQLKEANNKAELDIITAPSVCIPQERTNYCLVPPRLLMERNTENDVFSETSPCNEDIRLCGPTTECVPSKDKSFQCQCTNGFVATGAYKPFSGDDKSSIQICKDVDECLKPNVCPNTTECFNLYGSYDCLCKSNFRKPENDDIKIVGCVAVCDPNPCIHGTCNTTGNHGYTCSCDSSYTGFLCNETNTLVTNLKATLRHHSALIGGILGALLGVAIIVCFILLRKLKRKSVEGEDEYTKHRKRGILSEMTRLGRRQPKPENDDIEVERRNNPAIIANESGDYRRQYRDSDFAIPRPQVSERRESGDYRRGYSGDDQMSQKSSRHPEDAPVHGRRKLSRSYERLDADQRRISLAQYRNGAYEEE